MKLVSSDALEFEVDRTPDRRRRAAAGAILKLASRTIRLDDAIEADASVLVQSGVKPLDALHLAFAARADVEYFCTCDEKLLKMAQRLRSLKTTAVTPLELVMKVMP